MELLKTLQEQKLQVIDSYYQQVQQMQKYYERDHQAACVIQTFFRKHKQRITFMKAFFRGYHCRKYIHNFYARQQYLEKMKIKNQSFLQELNSLAEEERIYMEKNREAVARQEFNELAKNLHHLSSTQIIPGVYNAPYSRSKPLAFDVPIEVHLKNTFKANYKWKPLNKEQVLDYKQKFSVTAK